MFRLWLKYIWSAFTWRWSHS